MVILAENCQTTYGKPCHFPFEYNGKSRYACVKGLNSYWCSTTAKYDDSNYGDCSADCPTEDGKQLDILIKMSELSYKKQSITL